MIIEQQTSRAGSVPVHVMPEHGEGGDGHRAQVYALLSNLLIGPPDRELLKRLGAIEIAPHDDGRMTPLWRDLKEAALSFDAAGVDDEYHELFIGVAHGEIIPYASWFLCESLMEWPLTRVRSDLVKMGIRRRAERSEPEDHAAALCEVMCLLAEDTSQAGLERQRRFFRDHMEPWLGKFFRALANASNAAFYVPVARLGEAFLELERDYLAFSCAPINEEAGR